MSRDKLKRWQKWSAGLLMWLLLTLALQACVQSPAPSSASPVTSVQTVAASLSLTGQQPAINVSPDSENKVDTVLLDLLVQYQLNGKEGALKYAHERGIIDPNNNIVFTLILTTEDTSLVTNKVQEMGGTIKSSYKNMLSVAVPLDLLTNYATNNQARINFFQSLSSFSTVKEIRFLPPPSNSNDSADAALDKTQLQNALQKQYEPSQGVHTMGADVLQQQGLLGQNMKIGLIDGGFQDYQLFQDYLPPAFTIKDFTSFYGPNTTFHGVASAVVLHQIAPKAQIFAAPVDSWDGFCNALSWLTNTVKVKVAAVVLGWNGFGRGDGTGQLEDCINEARASGVLVLVAAGNDAYSHYSGTLNPQNGYHRFPNNTDRMKITTRGGSSVEVVLNWDDWESTPAIDLDLYVLDENGKIIASSRNVQSAGKPPYEYVDFPNKAGGTFYVQVKINKAPRNVKLNIHASNAAAYVEFPVAAGSLSVPADAKGALTVGATAWDDDTLADYSSQGPTTDGRIKPEISGPTDVTNPVYDTEVGRSFSGTSAATPHLAGAALLILQAHPEYSVDGLTKALTSHSHRLGQFVPNNQTGFGRVDLAFLKADLSSSPTTTALVTNPATETPNPVTTALSTSVVTAEPVATPTPKPVSKIAATTPPAVATTGGANGAKPPAVTTKSSNNPATAKTVLPSNTPTTSATPTLLPARTIFRDDFQDVATGLPNNPNITQSGYQNGTYSLPANFDKVSWVSYPALQSGDFTANITLTLPDTTQSFGGLVFWQSGERNYYTLLVDKTGQWELAHLNGETWQVISQWAKAPQLAGSRNLLQLETHGMDVKIGFNNKFVATFKTEGPFAKLWTLGLAGGTYQNSTTTMPKVFFNDFSYTIF